VTVDAWFADLLTFDAEGRIVTDHPYMIDWPEELPPWRNADATMIFSRDETLMGRTELEQVPNLKEHGRRAPPSHREINCAHKYQWPMR